MVNKMNIMVTGTRGFIGKNISEYLMSRNKHRVFNPLHGELELLDTDSVK